MPCDDVPEKVLVYCPRCKQSRELLYVSVLHNPTQYQSDGKHEYVSHCVSCAHARRRRNNERKSRQPVQPRPVIPQQRLPAASATDHEPGTPEKVSVMKTRFEAKQELYHPDDVNYLVISSRTLAWLQAIAEETIAEQQRLKANKTLSDTDDDTTDEE